MHLHRRAKDARLDRLAQRLGKGVDEVVIERFGDAARGGLAEARARALAGVAVEGELAYDERPAAGLSVYKVQERAVHLPRLVGE